MCERSASVPSDSVFPSYLPKDRDLMAVLGGSAKTASGKRHQKDCSLKTQKAK